MPTEGPLANSKTAWIGFARVDRWDHYQAVFEKTFGTVQRVNLDDSADVDEVNSEESEDASEECLYEDRLETHSLKTQNFGRKRKKEWVALKTQDPAED